MVKYYERKDSCAPLPQKVDRRLEKLGVHAWPASFLRIGLVDVRNDCELFLCKSPFNPFSEIKEPEGH